MKANTDKTMPTKSNTTSNTTTAPTLLTSSMPTIESVLDYLNQLDCNELTLNKVLELMKVIKEVSSKVNSSLAQLRSAGIGTGDSYVSAPSMGEYEIPSPFTSPVQPYQQLDTVAPAPYQPSAQPYQPGMNPYQTASMPQQPGYNPNLDSTSMVRPLPPMVVEPTPAQLHAEVSSKVQQLKQLETLSARANFQGSSDLRAHTSEEVRVRAVSDDIDIDNLPM